MAFPPIQYPFDSMFASQYSRIRKDHVPRNAANAKSLGDSLWSSPEMSSKISPSSFLRFFSIGIGQICCYLMLTGCIAWKNPAFSQLPNWPSIGSILRQLSHATLAQSCIAASCGMANRQMRSKYSHHFNTPEAPKFPAVSPVKDAKTACQPLELTTKVV